MLAIIEAFIAYFVTLENDIGTDFYFDSRNTCGNFHFALLQRCRHLPICNICAFCGKMLYLSDCALYRAYDKTIV